MTEKEFKELQEFKEFKEFKEFRSKAYSGTQPFLCLRFYSRPVARQAWRRRFLFLCFLRLFAAIT
jgi:hypothetical protein